MLVPERFQFTEGKPGRIVKNNITLDRYNQIMTTFPWEVNPKTNTLWLPVDSSNRTATLNLNHEVTGFNKDGYLTGLNGNCNTPYLIILVPMFWDSETLSQLGKLVLAKKRHSHFRILNAQNIDLIIDVINEHKEFH